MPVPNPSVEEIDAMTRQQKVALCAAWGIQTNHPTGQPIDIEARLALPKWQTKRNPEHV